MSTNPATILFMLIFYTQTRDSYYIGDFQTTAYYQCYKQQGYNHVTISIEPYYPEDISKSIQNMFNAKNAGLELGVMLILCRTMTPQEQIDIILKNMGVGAIS